MVTHRYQHQGYSGQVDRGGANVVRIHPCSLTIAPGNGPYYITLTVLPDGVLLQTCRSDLPEGQRRLEREIIRTCPLHVLADRAHDTVLAANREWRRG